MIKLTRSQLRKLILEAIDESISKSKAGKVLSAEYLYLLTQPLAVVGAELPIPQIKVPPHKTREEYGEEGAVEMRKEIGTEPEPEDLDAALFSIHPEEPPQASLDIKDQSTIWK